jgi:hypothetical protein
VELSDLDRRFLSRDPPRPRHRGGTRDTVEIRPLQMGCGASSPHGDAVTSPEALAVIVSRPGDGDDDRHQQQQQTPERRKSLILEGVRRVSATFADSVERRFSNVGIENGSSSPRKAGGGKV